MTSLIVLLPDDPVEISLNLPNHLYSYVIILVYCSLQVFLASSHPLILQQI
jgi:hypothetical protein